VAQTHHIYDSREVSSSMSTLRHRFRRRPEATPSPSRSGSFLAGSFKRHEGGDDPPLVTAGRWILRSATLLVTTPAPSRNASGAPTDR